MANDAARQDFEHVYALVRQHMHDLSMVREKRLALTAKSSAADGKVEVTVDARCVVTETVIDESYLDEFELADLGGHITSAARQAAGEIERRSAQLFGQLNERRDEIKSLAGMARDVPDFGELISRFNMSEAVMDRRGDDEDSGGSTRDARFPTVKG